jgi:hypothetical protein
VAFALPFLLASTQFEFLKLLSEIARWGMLAAACGLAALHGFGRGPRGRVGIGVPDFLALGFLGFFALTAVWAIEAFYSIQRTVSFGLLYVTVFWWGWSYADRFGDTRLLQLFLRTAAVILGLNLLMFGVLTPTTLIVRRFSGYFDNPNNIGLICAISLPLVFAQWLRNRGKLDILVFAVFLLSLLACGSRTGAVSSAVGILLILGIHAIRGNRLAVVFVVCFAALAGFASTTDFFSENIARVDSLDTLSNRTVFWEMARFNYIPKRPWLGHGFGTDLYIHQYYGISLKEVKLRGYGVMSSYFGLAVAVGIPGAVLFYLATIGGLVRPLTRYRRDPQLIALSGMVVAGLLVGITESAIYSVGGTFCYLYWMGFALMIRRTVYHRMRVPLTVGGGLKKVGREGRARRRVKGRERLPGDPAFPPQAAQR